MSTMRKNRTSRPAGNYFSTANNALRRPPQKPNCDTTIHDGHDRIGTAVHRTLARDKLGGGPHRVGGLDFRTSLEKYPSTRHFSTCFLRFHRDFVLCRAFRWQRARRFPWNIPLLLQNHHAIRTVLSIVSRADATLADWAVFYVPISDAQRAFRTGFINN